MHRRPRLLWRLYLSSMLVTMPALLAVGWLAYRESREHYLAQTAGGLRVRATLLAEFLRRDFEIHGQNGIQRFVRILGRTTQTRYTVIGADGRVIADSEHDPRKMDNHRDRREIRVALGGQTGQSTRYSDTLGRQMMYVAIPYRLLHARAPTMKAGSPESVSASEPGSGAMMGVPEARLPGRAPPAGAVRAAIPLRTISGSLSGLLGRIGVAALLVALLAALLALLVAHRINRPLLRMQEGARRFAAGDLRYRLPVPRTEETGQLAQAMNEMAGELDARIRLVTRQRNQLEAMLTSMVEAVVVADARGHLIQVNRAAEQLLGLDPETALGASLDLALDNPDLQAFLKRVLEAGSPLEADLELERDGTRHLRAVGTRLRDHAGQSMGAMVVLHDVTRLTRLESMRRDFVANVSHELKTPITSIQGFVETLRDGAIEEEDNARRFLDIIARHAERLDAIIEDLLSLSRIEQDGEAGHIPTTSQPLGDVLRGAMRLCEEKASSGGVSLALEAPEPVEAPVNAVLLQQAVVNLIENAIKHTEAGGRVTVGLAHEADQVLVRVADTGCGIAPEHQPRIFERFYRVDKARSRAGGGTGLGLAIVKHIAAAHGGTVAVRSTPGEGSTFTLRLPALNSVSRL